MERNKQEYMRNACSIFLMVVCVICVFSSEGFPSEWCFVASSKNFYYYVDADSITSSGKNITFSIVQQEIESGKVLFKKRFTINCEDETVAMRETVRYGFSGALKDLFSSERPDEWAEIRPRSKMHAVHDILCCDSRPRHNVTEYLQRTSVRKEELKIFSDVLPEKQ